MDMLENYIRIIEEKNSMRNKLFRKSLVFGIIILFVATSIVPSISGSIGEVNKKQDIVDYADNVAPSSTKNFLDDLAYEDKNVYVDSEKTERNRLPLFSEDYDVQWEMNFGSNRRYGARYEGPQPIGDCDNDGKNEVLIGGRDGCLRIFEWDETKQTYLQMHTLHSPFYPSQSLDAGGFAIGDLTGDGKNEIAVTWYATVYKWIAGKYRIIGYNPWIFWNGGGSADCYIGDYDNDGKNELIMSGGSMTGLSKVPEIMVYGWNGLRLVKEAQWDDPDVNGFVYMAGLGDVDEDGENEIVCGSANKVVVLDWDKDDKEFEATVIKETYGWERYPFACVCKDSDMDGKNEIHVGYYSPEITIFEWNGTGYEIKFEQYWLDEGALIEGLDVGDVDEDGVAEVCAGTDIIHILQWDGDTYVEEATIPTFGSLAVVSIGDCDNDGKNEIHAGSVMVSQGHDFMSWIFKYELGSAGLDNQEGFPLISSYDDEGSRNNHIITKTTMETGSIKVIVKSALLRVPLNGACIAAWNLDAGVWYDIPSNDEDGIYIRYNLPTGEYLLRVINEGYQIKETTVAIYAGQQTTHTFYLRPVLIKDSFNAEQVVLPVDAELELVNQQSSQSNN